MTDSTPPAHGSTPPAPDQPPAAAQPGPGHPQPAQPGPAYPGYAPQPGYAAQPGYPGYYAPPTNTLAIITIIAAFLLPIAGIVTGHIALNQIDRTGEGGRGMAQAGLIISYVFTALYVVAIVLVIISFATFGAFFGGVVNEFPWDRIDRFDTP